MTSPSMSESSRIARFASGAWRVPRGFLFLLRNPSLLPLVILPAVIAGVLLVAGFILGVWAAPLVEARIAAGQTVPAWLSLPRSFFIWVATLSAGAAAGFGVALLLVSPILDQLSRRVEARVRGFLDDRGQGLTWEVVQSLRGAFYFLAAAPGVLLLAFIPIAGPPLAFLWAAYALGFQFFDPPLTRRGLDFAAKRAWHRRHRAEAIGFGAAGLFALFIPLADLLVAPTLAAAATLLVLDLEERDEERGVARERSEEVSMTRRN
ncbi:MAG: EI24 domain-containing protein [Vicinamibacteria bacterium]